MQGACAGGVCPVGEFFYGIIYICSVSVCNFRRDGEVCFHRGAAFGFGGGNMLFYVAYSSPLPISSVRPDPD